MKVKTLFDDPAGRWMAGEVGEVLENTYAEKYDYEVKLNGAVPLHNFLGTGQTVYAVRVYYFYKSEVEVVPEEQVRGQANHRE